MNLNYTHLHTGSHDKKVNYYISHLLYEVISDVGSEPLDIALRATSWDWDKWFYVPDNILSMLNEAELEKLRAQITKGLFKVVDDYEDLLSYLRWIGQDRVLTDYLHFIPRTYGIQVFYPHVSEQQGVTNASSDLYR